MTQRTIRRPKLLWRNHLPGVVAAVRDQTDQAAQLAQINGQHMLTDPRTNPAVRPLVDQFRNEQHRLLLEAEHGRHKRRHRVADRRAADAELTLQALLQAQQASSPARSVLALHRGRARFMGAALTGSLALSIGSAAGVGQLAEDLDAPKVTGYVAEVGMVGASMLAILYRAHLSQHGWKGSGWKGLTMWAFAIMPLLASVVANAFGAGPVGVACSIGAAALGAFAHLIADTSAEALRDKAEEVTGHDEAALRAVAMGDDLFSAPPTRDGSPTHGELANQQVHEPVPNLPMICDRFLNLEPNRNRPTGPEPANRRTTNQEVREPEPANRKPGEPANSTTVREPAPNREPRTANLSDRAARKEAEVQQVLNLIDKHGFDTVKLSTVQRELGFTKTTAHHRLKEARDRFVNQEAAS